jgi:hypothetical protein
LQPAWGRRLEEKNGRAIQVSNLMGIYGGPGLISRSIIPFDVSEMARLGGNETVTIPSPGPFSKQFRDSIHNHIHNQLGQSLAAV